jgi:hypothetical protein
MWTDITVARLKDGIKLYGTDWERVSAHVGDRIPTNKCIRYYKMNIETQKCSRWSVEEDMLLLDSVVTHDKRVHKMALWTYVSGRIPGRENKRCRERWLMLSEPGRKRTCDWTGVDMEKLEKAVGIFGYKWQIIKKCYFNGWTANDLKNKWYSNIRKHTIKTPRKSNNNKKIKTYSPRI